MIDRVYNEDGPTEDPEITTYGILHTLAEQVAAHADNVHRRTLRELFDTHGIEVDLSDEKVATIPQQLREQGYILVSEKIDNKYILTLAKIVETKGYEITINFKFEEKTD